MMVMMMSSIMDSNKLRSAFFFSFLSFSSFFLGAFKQASKQTQKSHTKKVLERKRAESE